MVCRCCIRRGPPCRFLDRADVLSVDDDGPGTGEPVSCGHGLYDTSRRDIGTEGDDGGGEAGWEVCVMAK